MKTAPNINTNLTKHKCDKCQELIICDDILICDNCHKNYCGECLTHHISSSQSQYICHICDDCFESLTEF